MGDIEFTGPKRGSVGAGRHAALPDWLAGTSHGVARLFEQPTVVAAAFWLAGAVAAFVADALGHWSSTDQGFLLAAGVVCAATAVAHLWMGRQMPMWSMQVAAVVSVVLVSVGASIGPRNGMHIAVLYIWILVYVALYFSPVEAAAYAVAVGTAYALVLAYGPPQAAPVADWLGVVGTGVFAGVVVAVLVNLLRHDARHDPLTGLANRRSWDERLDEELERARRSGLPLSIALIDLDGFKALNDTEGHAAGDLLLQRAAAAWSGTVREAGDFLARVGGDEFAVLAPDSDVAGVRALAARLTARTPDGITFSCGEATWDGRETPGDLVHRADAAMYRAKRSHRPAATPGPTCGHARSGRRGAPASGPGRHRT